VVTRLLGGSFLVLAAQAAAENEIMALLPQQTGARIAIAGDQLVWSNRDRLEMWDLAKRRLNARMTPTVHASALGVVDGEIIAVGADPAMKFPWLTRFPGFHPDHVPAEHGYFFSGAGTAWLTTRDSLCLVELASVRARVVWRKRFAGGIYHLARAGDLAALLTIETRAGAWHVVRVTAVDSRGTVRWSRDLRPPRLTEAWVAGSSHHVGVALGEKLLVWRASDGVVVVPAPP
jgi:hypothetical protein